MTSVFIIATIFFNVSWQSQKQVSCGCYGAGLKALTGCCLYLSQVSGEPFSAVSKLKRSVPGSPPSLTLFSAARAARLDNCPRAGLLSPSSCFHSSRTKVLLQLESFEGWKVKPSTQIHQVDPVLDRRPSSGAEHVCLPAARFSSAADKAGHYTRFNLTAVNRRWQRTS